MEEMRVRRRADLLPVQRICSNVVRIKRREKRKIKTILILVSLKKKETHACIELTLFYKEPVYTT